MAENRTDWADIPFELMHQIVHAEDAGRQQAAARGWRSLAETVEAVSANLTRYRDRVAPDWNSAAGEVFRGEMTDVIGSLDSAAHSARSYAGILDTTAAAVLEAQRKMDEVSAQRSAYLEQKDDYNNLGDDNDTWHDFLDGVDDVVHNITGDNDIDPVRLREFDQQGEAIMRHLGNAYLNVEAGRPAIPQYQGPVAVVPANLMVAAPGAPGAPSAPG
ncbi:MAG: hypothetical protein HKP61_02470, partial [Dactylosporangium sp.]|nr:hypothetical protein [Dactylosporangium sp.]NNJ59826.1 hypothetical protein [Dactylosporangium sp.]